MALTDCNNFGSEERERERGREREKERNKLYQV